MTGEKPRENPLARGKTAGKEEEIYAKIDSLRKKESLRLLQFLLALAGLTFFALVFLIGFFGETRAWQLYFIAVFVLVVWLAFRLLEFEAEIEDLGEKLTEKR